MENIYTVIITAATILGSASAWRYYEKRANKRDEDDRFIRHDCQSRIAKLEALLGESSKEKDELRGQILHLTAMVSKLQTQVEYLTNKK